MATPLMAAATVHMAGKTEAAAKAMCDDADAGKQLRFLDGSVRYEVYRQIWPEPPWTLSGRFVRPQLEVPFFPKRRSTS